MPYRPKPLTLSGFFTPANALYNHVRHYVELTAPKPRLYKGMNNDHSHKVDSVPDSCLITTVSIIKQNIKKPAKAGFL